MACGCGGAQSVSTATPEQLTAAAEMRQRQEEQLADQMRASQQAAIDNANGTNGAVAQS